MTTNPINPNITNLNVAVNPQIPPQPNSTTPQTPWHKTQAEKNSPVHPEDNLPNSSYVLPSTRNTADSKIVSINSNHSHNLFIYPLILILILIVPSILLIASSYNNWPESLPIPDSIKYKTDLFILNSPLTPTANQIFRTSTAHLSLQNSISHQIILKTRQSDGTQFTTTISGISNTPLTTADMTLATRYQHLSDEITTNSNVILKNNKLYFQINQHNPTSHFNLLPLNNQWITIPNIIEVTQTTSPGQLALAKIRNKKNHQAISNFLQTMYNNTILIDTEPDLPETHYLLSYTMQPEQLPQLIQEILHNYQDSNLHYFNEAQLKHIETILQKSLSSRIKFEILINKDTLLPDRIDLSTIIFPPTSDNLNNLDKIQQKIITEIDYSPTYSNPDINPSTPNDAIPYDQVNWPEYITLPLLLPILDTSIPQQ